MPNGLPGGVKKKKKKKKKDKKKEKHNQDNKKNQTGKQAKIYLLKKIGLTLMASTSILNTTAATPL